MRFLFLIFILLPITELWLLIQVGGALGVMPTLCLVFLTAFFGINILKREGFSTLTRAREKLQVGELPATQIVEGFLLAIGGALLLTPGFITDFVGLILILPWSRQAIAAAVINQGVVQALGRGNESFSYTHYTSSRRAESQQDQASGDTFEGEIIPNSSAIEKK